MNLPSINPKLRQVNDTLEIFDPIRKQYYVLNPEEWVRQHFVGFMINELGYPKSLIQIESGIKYNQLLKRPDIVALDRSGNARMLVECKSAEVKINQKTFEQASVYNKVIQAKYLVVTNGIQHFCCDQDFEKGTTNFLNEIPAFSE